MRSLLSRLVASVLGVTSGFVLFPALFGPEVDVAREPVTAQFVERDPSVPTASERRANRDCEPMASYKRNHDGYPSPYVLVRWDESGETERLPFVQAYHLGSTGRVWNLLACERR